MPVTEVWTKHGYITVDVDDEGRPVVPAEFVSGGYATKGTWLDTDAGRDFIDKVFSPAVVVVGIIAITCLLVSLMQPTL